MQPNQGNLSEQDTQDKRKLIKRLLTVTGSFLVCFVPFVVVSAIFQHTARFIACHTFSFTLAAV